MYIMLKSNAVTVFGLQMKLPFHESNLSPTVFDLSPLPNVCILSKHRKLPPPHLMPIEKLKTNYPISNDKRAVSHYWSKKTCYMQTNGYIISCLGIKTKNVFIEIEANSKKLLKGNKEKASCCFVSKYSF